MSINRKSKHHSKDFSNGQSYTCKRQTIDPMKESRLFSVKNIPLDVRHKRNRKENLNHPSGQASSHQDGSCKAVSDYTDLKMSRAVRKSYHQTNKKEVLYGSKDSMSSKIDMQVQMFTEKSLSTLPDYREAPKEAGISEKLVRKLFEAKNKDLKLYVFNQEPQWERFKKMIENQRTERLSLAE